MVGRLVVLLLVANVAWFAWSQGWLRVLGLAPTVQAEPERLFKPGERVRLTEAPFAGIEGIYQMADGERRVMVLIELLSKQVRVRVAPANLRKVG